MNNFRRWGGVSFWAPRASGSLIGTYHYLLNTKLRNGSHIMISAAVLARMYKSYCESYESTILNLKVNLKVLLVARHTHTNPGPAAI